MIALLRYIWSDTLRSGRWVAPLLVYVALEAVIDAGNGSVLPTFAISATVLLLVSIWLTVAICNLEDPVQEAVTAVLAGGPTRLRLAKLGAAYLGSVALAATALIAPPILSTQGATASELLSGLCAHLLTGLAGVAVGAICSRPIITRTAWAVLAGALAGFADVIIPNCPPARQLLVIFNKLGPYHYALPILSVAAETVALSAAFVGLSLGIARTRS